MHGLKSGSCRFWQRTDSPPGSNMLRAEIQRALRRAPRQLRRLARLANSPGFKSFRCPRERLKFSLERFSDPSQIDVRTQPLKNSAGRVPQAAAGLTHALRLEMGTQCRKTTPVAHFRGSKLQCLCEAARPTEVHACVPSCHLMAPTLANQILARTFFRSVAHLFAYPAVEKFCRASSAGDRRHLQ